MKRFSIVSLPNGETAKFSTMERTSGPGWLVHAPPLVEGEYEAVEVPEGVLIRRIGPPHPDDLAVGER